MICDTEFSLLRYIKACKYFRSKEVLMGHICVDTEDGFGVIK